MLAPRSSDDVRNRNRKRILASLRSSGIASRTEIGKLTGLSAATVSAITSDFLEEGILIRPCLSESANSGPGRPKVALAVNPDVAIVCAVYIHLNGISAAIVDFAGTTICDVVTEASTVEATSEEIRHNLLHSIHQALEKSSLHSSELCRIAVGFQGVVDFEGSKVLWTPICDKNDIPIQQWISEEFNVPSKVANDCDMIARALSWRAPTKYDENFAAVLLAHGVGMGLHLRDRIINGTRSSGIEFGHMIYKPDGALCRCGNYGCIEAYAGDYSISRRAQAKPGHTAPINLLEKPDLESIMIAARVGDADAIEAIEFAGAAIGTGLANLFTLVDPFPVALVGRGAILFSQMEKSLRSSLSLAPNYDPNKPIEIECFPDENPLVLDGCAISALLLQDDIISGKRERKNQVRALQQQERV